MNTNAVAVYWQQPYAVLAGTGGHHFDVFRLRRAVASQVLHIIGDDQPRGPVAVLPDDRWLFFVEAGAPPEDLLGRAAQHHGSGHWVPLPPTRIGRRAVAWQVDPAGVGWRLFRRHRFYDALRAIRPGRQSRYRS
jgi:hypothetical protein